MTTGKYKPIKPQLYELAAISVREGLSQLREYISLNKFIPKVSDWRKQSQFDNGAPHFVSSDEDAPLNYSYALAQSRNSTGSSKISSFEQFVTALVADKDYLDAHRSRYREDISQKDLDHLVRFF